VSSNYGDDDADVTNNTIIVVNLCENSFLRERLHCEEALVSSACGDEAGNFAFTIGKLYTEKISTRHGCEITRDTSYNSNIID